MMDFSTSNYSYIHIQTSTLTRIQHYMTKGVLTKTDLHIDEQLSKK